MTDEDLDDIAAHPVQQHAGAQFRHGSLRIRGRSPRRSASARSAARAVGEHVLEQQRRAVRTGQRHPPVRVLVGGARLVLGAHVADRIGQRQREQPRRGPAQVAVQRQRSTSSIVGVGAAAARPGAARPARPPARRGRRPVPRRRAGSAGPARRAAGRAHRPDSRPSAAGRGWSPRTGSTPATARPAAVRRRRRGRARTTGSRCRAGRARAGSRAPTARRCRGPRRPRPRRPGAPPARRCRSSPRGRSARRCPRSAGRPSGIHHSRNSPMMWSMRTPPACRSTASTSARNGCVAELVEPVGPPRRLRPVLAELVELVGRCARGDAERQHVLQRPGVGAVGVARRRRGRA